MKMHWIIYVSGAVALFGLALIAWDTWRVRRQREQELRRLR